MKKLAVASLVLLASCSWSGRQYDSFTGWSGRQFDSAGNAIGDITPSKDDLTPSKPVFKNHYEGYPYDNSKVLTDGQTMKTVPPTVYTSGTTKTAPTQEIVDPKTNTPVLPGEGVSTK